MAEQSFSQFIQRLELVFDDAVVNGDDDELFASGYLRGHFDLVVAQLELQQQHDPAAVLPGVREAVDETRHELSPADQQHIANMIARLEAAAV
ncbi:YfcL family protein [Pseudidiomarina insulisalsae]|uniref:YfcL family protein n=1 Tax=Pseudidiomarina insulisalsae TaxID=575789 RepID=UPI001F545145|nr:YfcL family protein [Pseudidiomarina insulisalsae]